MALHREVLVSGMDDLVTWLRAQLDGDERVARAAAGSLRCGCHPGAFAGAWTPDDDRVLIASDVGHGVADSSGFGGLKNEVAQHIARWDPARVLAEVDAKRRILDRLARWLDVEDEYDAVQTTLRAEGKDMVRDLAAPYAGRDGWREEWRTQP
jgi:hypothetical protein